MVGRGKEKHLELIKGAVIKAISEIENIRKITIEDTHISLIANFSWSREIHLTTGVESINPDIMIECYDLKNRGEWNGRKHHTKERVILIEVENPPVRLSFGKAHAYRMLGENPDNKEKLLLVLAVWKGTKIPNEVRKIFDEVWEFEKGDSIEKNNMNGGR